MVVVAILNFTGILDKKHILQLLGIVRREWTLLVLKDTEVQCNVGAKI